MKNRSESLKKLKEFALKRKRKQHPHWPDHILTAKNYSDKTANKLTEAIKEFLQMSGWQAERINCMGRMIDRRKTYIDVVGFKRTIGSIEWVRSTGTPGTADISATIKGRSVKIEIKIGADRQSEAQRNYQQNIERSGGVYFIARNFDDFIDWYSNTFKIEPFII